MNIVVITAEFPYPANSGGRIYTWQRLKYLSKNNKLYLYSISDDKDYEYKDNEILKSIFEVVNLYKRENKIINGLKGIKYPYSVATRKIESMKNDINLLISRKKIDLIIIDHPQMMINCPINNDIPKVLTQHNIEYLAFESMYKNTNNILKKILYKREYYLMKKFEEQYYNQNKIDGYTFISEDDKTYFEKKYNNKNNKLIPPGIEYLNTNYIKKHGKNIVFTGKMDYEPNIQAVEWFCKEILPIIKASINDVKFYIVGKNPTDAVKKLSSDNVIVTGIVDDIVEYLEMADIVVIPLLSGGGVKIKLIEAIQNSNIVITTSKGVEGTRFEDKNHILIANEANSFANSCIDVIKKPQNFENLKLASIDFIKENYLWTSIGKNYELFLKYVVDNK